jgi:tetratricopeptide (TPR) repeat protein
MRFASIASVLGLCACAGSAPPSETPSNPAAPSASASAEPAPTATATPVPERDTHPALSWIEDDVPGAMTKAKAEGKLVFVDTWAEWCHTCLSMRHFVLDAPALRSLGDSVVFVSVDTENEKNAAFVDKVAIDVWPTFFVLDPKSGDVLGYWPGSASIREMDGFVRDTLAARDALQASKLDPKSELALLLAAKRSQARSAYDEAASLYAQCVAKAPKDWNRRSEALLGWIGALFNAGRADQCIEVGLAHVDELKGASKPTDFVRTLSDCAEHAKSAAQAQKANQVALAKLRDLADHPNPESTPDDQADTLGVLADMLAQAGDKKAARAVHGRRLALLEDAAAKAGSPAAAATYDYARANAYLSLGRADEAVKMLEQREKELAGSYEPPARLAGILNALKRYPEALAAIDRALAHADGPRRLGYLDTKADIQAALGDRKGQLATLEALVAGYEAHAKRQKGKPKRLTIAQRRLAEAKKALADAQHER